VTIGTVDRRTFIVTAIGLLAAPLALEAQQAEKVWRIGVFYVGDHIPPGLQTLRDGLKALGYEEGKNLQLDFRNLADEEAASRTAREFVQSRPDLIVTFGNPVARAARLSPPRFPS
jgi:putative ABC transport system substrate-binding protein